MPIFMLNNNVLLLGLKKRCEALVIRVRQLPETLKTLLKRLRRESDAPR